MKKLYFAAIIAIVTQTAFTKNSNYPLIGRLSEDNKIRKNCENLNPAFLGIWKNDVEKACDSIEARLAIVAREQGYGTQGFAFSYLVARRITYWTSEDRKKNKQIIDATFENQHHIETIIGIPAIYKERELENKTKEELEALAILLCDENATQSK